MIAYFILVHRYPEQFKRLFRAIYEPGNQYLVHIDKNSGTDLAADIAEFLAPYESAEILEPRKAQWGGYSLVDAELRGMERLLEMDDEWTHFINLSGQDFPLKSQGYIRNFLRANGGRQFIRAVDQQNIRPDTMNRVSHYFVEALGRIFRTRIRRSYLADARPFIGTQWKAVTRQFCAFVCHDPRVDRFKRFYRHSFIADESFFQSVIMNSGDHGEVVNDDLRLIDWVPDGDIKLRPRNFGVADMQRLTQSRDLFARKFDSAEDGTILGLLEAHLETDSACLFAPSIDRIAIPASHPEPPVGVQPATVGDPLPIAA